MNPNFNLQPDELLAQKNAPKDSPTEGVHAKAIRTFEEDIAGAVRDGKGSVLGIALAEQKRKDAQNEFVAEKKSGSFIILIGVLFIMLALGLLGFVGYSVYSDKVLVAKRLQQGAAERSEERRVGKEC